MMWATASPKEKRWIRTNDQYMEMSSMVEARQNQMTRRNALFSIPLNIFR